MNFDSETESFINLNKDDTFDEDSLDTDYSNNSQEIASSVDYFRPDKTQLVYNGFLYNLIRKNKNETIRWRCASCAQCSLVTKHDQIYRHPSKNARHKPSKCYVMLEWEKVCLQKYEQLKHDARKPEFKFKQEYNKALSYLKYLYPPDIVELYWPNENTARSTINSIRQKHVRNSKDKKAVN